MQHSSKHTQSCRKPSNKGSSEEETISKEVLGGFLHDFEAENRKFFFRPTRTSTLVADCSAGDYITVTSFEECTRFPEMHSANNHMPAPVTACAAYFSDTHQTGQAFTAVSPHCGVSYTPNWLVNDRGDPAFGGHVISERCGTAFCREIQAGSVHFQGLYHPIMYEMQQNYAANNGMHVLTPYEAAHFQRLHMNRFNPVTYQVPTSFPYAQCQSGCEAALFLMQTAQLSRAMYYPTSIQIPPPFRHGTVGHGYRGDGTYGPLWQG